MTSAPYVNVTVVESNDVHFDDSDSSNFDDVGVHSHDEILGKMPFAMNFLENTEIHFETISTQIWAVTHHYCIKSDNVKHTYSVFRNNQ